MARVGILISQYIEIAGLNQDADGIYHGGDALFLIFQTFEILFVEYDGRGYFLSGNHLLLLVLEHHIVSYFDGRSEILIGNGIEGRSPLGVVIYRIIEKNAFRFRIVFIVLVRNLKWSGDCVPSGCRALFERCISEATPSDGSLGPLLLGFIPGIRTAYGA